VNIWCEVYSDAPPITSSFDAGSVCSRSRCCYASIALNVSNTFIFAHDLHARQDPSRRLTTTDCFSLDRYVNVHTVYTRSAVTYHWIDITGLSLYTVVHKNTWQLTYVSNVDKSYLFLHHVNPLTASVAIWVQL